MTISVGSGGNDVNEDGSSYVPSFAAVWFGNAGSTTASYTGLRFANINIPQGATILSARLEVYSASQPQWIAISFQYAGEASDNSAPFSAGSKPSQRPLTAARVNHSSSVNWNANTWYQLDDIRVIVQEIINRPGWQSGNSLSIILRGTGTAYGRKFVRAFEGGATGAVRLIITYHT